MAVAAVQSRGICLQLGPDLRPQHPKTSSHVRSGNLGCEAAWKHAAPPSPPCSAAVIASPRPVPAILLGFAQSAVCRDHNLWGRTRSQQPFHNCH